MGGKKKRKRAGAVDNASKRMRIDVSASNRNVVRRSLLPYYYKEVVSLREYLLMRLPGASKVRRKKITSLGHRPPLAASLGGMEETSLAQYLDDTLVGITESDETRKDERTKEWMNFSQHPNRSVSALNDLVGGRYCQSEIIEFAIWSLLSQPKKDNMKSQHLLCQGFRKGADALPGPANVNPISSIPGVISTHPNHLVNIMKSSPWPQILHLLGKEGEKEMIDMVLDCGIYRLRQSCCGQYYQISGVPLGELSAIASVPTSDTPKQKEPLEVKGSNESGILPLASILFVRNRILYSRPALNKRGQIRFGLPHIHVLNRYALKSPKLTPRIEDARATDADPLNRDKAVHIMMHIFPREFGLHNVLSSKVDSRETSQSSKDYTFRENEIRAKYDGTNIGIPRRLRGEAVHLVHKLQILHNRCAYTELLNHYCPIKEKNTNFSSPASTPLMSDHKTDRPELKSQLTPVPRESRIISPSTVDVDTRQRRTSMLDQATPTHKVSAFCQAVFGAIIPDEFWGGPSSRTRNKQAIMQNIDWFVKMRRFESLSLHDVCQRIALNDISWSALLNNSSIKSSSSDRAKRLQLLAEFLYYLFDSILIPLVRNNFHVTESNVHQSRLFYFRQDVWREMCEPEIATMKREMYEELDSEHLRHILSSRKLGFSFVRLLPKSNGFRPITNLKRRTALQGYQNRLGPSINSVMKPVFDVLTFEKKVAPQRFGSALFGVGDIYSKLRAFKSVIRNKGRLFFVKVDVKGAFDTIPQEAVMRLISQLPNQSQYRISKHVEIKPGDRDGTGRPILKWVSAAAPRDADDLGNGRVESGLESGKQNTVYVDNIVNQYRGKADLLRLLAQHIECNLIKIGKKFYRQKEGIPQGSIVSSLLCNYFYADLEKKHLSFLQDGETLLLRLIDDFLLVTTNRSHARKFSQIMHDGLPEYGVSVNPDKTLTNFEITTNGKKLARLVEGNAFPYCGCLIDTRTLDLRKLREVRQGMSKFIQRHDFQNASLLTNLLDIADSLTVNFSRNPGSLFRRKILNAFKIQAHPMFLDTSFNSLDTVVRNIYESLKQTALKMWAYAKCLTLKQPRSDLIIRTILDLVLLVNELLRGKKKVLAEYECAVSRSQVEWLVMTAFSHILKRKQGRYGEVLTWLNGRIDQLQSNRSSNFEIVGRKIRQLELQRVV